MSAVLRGRRITYVRHTTTHTQLNTHSNTGTHTFTQVVAKCCCIFYHQLYLCSKGVTRTNTHTHTHTTIWTHTCCVFYFQLQFTANSATQKLITAERDREGEKEREKEREKGRREGGRGPISVAYVQVIFCNVKWTHWLVYTHTNTRTHTYCIFYHQFKERELVAFFTCAHNSFNCNLPLILQHLLALRERERERKKEIKTLL